MPQDHRSRRDFLKAGSLLAGASLLPGSLHGNTGEPAGGLPQTYAYPNPGRIAIVHHPGAVLGFNSVDEQVVQGMFDQGIMQLAGIYTSPAAALASFFPGLTVNSRVALKPNFLNSVVPTRKELTKAVINRLRQMLGGFPAANITVYERHSFSSVGYTTGYFGHNVNLVYDASFPNLGYTIHCDGKDRPYSASLHNADYLINMPVLKDHSCSSSLNLTLAFKNHMGTVNPGGSLGIHCNKNAVLDIMASSVMRAKQKLVILDALYAVYNGGPGGNPQATPNKILLSQDPVAIDAQGRIMINNLRTTNGLGAKNATYIDQAAASPYSLGVADPAQMTVINIALPVRLAAFTADLRGGVVELRWTTESETNNAGFGIERSANGLSGWTEIGYVRGAGTTTQRRDYRFADENSQLLRDHRTLFYRLRQVDTDGAMEYSPTVEVALQLNEASWNLEQNYPNPFVHDTDLPLFLPREAHVQLDVFGITGERVATLVCETMPAGMHYLTFHAADLPAGTYVARAMAEGSSREIQLLRVK
ncbi:MAG: DUF362 domain-containing protein [Bacteroidia bacterium]|nr:DUF362 domain-containing protein [Bacteroidia bacterium]